MKIQVIKNGITIMVVDPVSFFGDREELITVVSREIGRAIKDSTTEEITVNIKTDFKGGKSED